MVKFKQNVNLVKISTKYTEIFKNLQTCPIGNVLRSLQQINSSANSIKNKVIII